MATIIDFGGARPMGTSGLYSTTFALKMFPWVAPELLWNTHPCSVASDVYSIAEFIIQLLGWQPKFERYPSLQALRKWLWKARDPYPSLRPTLDALIQILKTLQVEVAASVYLHVSASVGRQVMLIIKL